MDFPDIPGILLEKKKPYRISSRTSNKSLGQLARKRPHETPQRTMLRRQAEAELRRRYTIRDATPSKSAVAQHIGDLAVGKKRLIDPAHAARLKDVSIKTIQAAINRALREYHEGKPKKQAERKIAALQKQLDKYEQEKQEQPKIEPKKPSKIAKIVGKITGKEEEKEKEKKPESLIGGKLSPEDIKKIERENPRRN